MGSKPALSRYPADPKPVDAAPVWHQHMYVCVKVGVDVRRYRWVNGASTGLVEWGLLGMLAWLLVATVTPGLGEFAGEGVMPYLLGEGAHTVSVWVSCQVVL